MGSVDLYANTSPGLYSEKAPRAALETRSVAINSARFSKPWFQSLVCSGVQMVLSPFCSAAPDAMRSRSCTVALPSALPCSSRSTSPAFDCSVSLPAQMACPTAMAVTVLPMDMPKNSDSESAGALNAEYTMVLPSSSAKALAGRWPTRARARSTRALSPADGARVFSLLGLGLGCVIWNQRGPVLASSHSSGAAAPPSATGVT